MSIQRRHILLFAATLAAASFALPAVASDPTATTPLPAWEQLSQVQREQLIAPIRDRWNREPGKRQHMLESSQRWEAMTPEQRRHARHGMRRWKHLSAEQRQDAKALFARMRDLPPEQRKTFKNEWKQMTPEQRRTWLQAHPAGD